METPYLKEKLIFVFGFTILFASCQGDKEKYNREYQKIKKELDSLDKLVLYRKDLELKKKNLEDSLQEFLQPYDIEIEGWNKKINEKQRDYFQELAKIKDYYYSKYGHNPSYQSQMDEAMQKAATKSGKLIAPYHTKINEIKRKLEVDKKYQKINQDIDSLSILISKSADKSNSSVEKKREELNKKLIVLEKKLKN